MRYMDRAATPPERLMNPYAIRLIQAADIIKVHGKRSVDHVIGLITQAVQRGDDGAVTHLDGLLREIEAQQARRLS